MSKTTKAIAILGVVAGLGVAALPFNAMAADLTPLNGSNNTPVTDCVVVKATIKDYISIELNGVTGEGTFDETDATDATEANKYHIHTLDLGSLVNGGDIAQGSLLVNVKTNNAKGYKLGLRALGANLIGEADSTNNLIPTGKPEVGKSLWGVKVATGTNSTNLTTVADFADWHQVPTSSTNIANSSTATDNNGTDTKVTFGVSASANQAADTYKQTVIFTAATEATVETND